jgi:hypothetical protein
LKSRGNVKSKLVSSKRGLRTRHSEFKKRKSGRKMKRSALRKRESSRKRGSALRDSSRKKGNS